MAAAGAKNPDALLSPEKNNKDTAIQNEMAALDEWSALGMYAPEPWTLKPKLIDCRSVGRPRHASTETPNSKP
jgi:hypothetical protein